MPVTASVADGLAQAAAMAAAGNCVMSDEARRTSGSSISLGMTSAGSGGPPRAALTMLPPSRPGASSVRILSLAVQTWPRFGWPHRWHLFFDSCPASRSLRPFSIRCHRLRTDETERPGSCCTMRDHLGPISASRRRMVLSSSGSHARMCSCTPPVIVAVRVWDTGWGYGLTRGRAARKRKRGCGARKKKLRA
eukprot:scaffold50837_cov24-Tisochrysis_lutea.AAC.1